MDGAITGDDYSAIDFNILVPNSDGWYNGDFNYDGAITGDDYSAIDFNILAQGAPFPTGALRRFERRDRGAGTGVAVGARAGRVSPWSAAVAVASTRTAAHNDCALSLPCKPPPSPRWRRLPLFFAIVIAVAAGCAAPGPSQPRVVHNLNSGDWKFLRSANAQGGPWRRVSLPHTWNGRDGQDGGGDVLSGRVLVPAFACPAIPARDAGKRFVVRFEGGGDGGRVVRERRPRRAGAPRRVRRVRLRRNGPRPAGRR
jgi:hypothetical protein